MSEIVDGTDMRKSCLVSRWNEERSVWNRMGVESARSHRYQLVNMSRKQSRVTAKAIFLICCFTSSSLIFVPDILLKSGNSALLKSHRRTPAFSQSLFAIRREDRADSLAYLFAASVKERHHGMVINRSRLRSV